MPCFVGCTCALFFGSCEFFGTSQRTSSPHQGFKTVTCFRSLKRRRLHSFQNRIMPLPRSDTSCSAGVAGSGHPIKAPVCSLSHLFDTFAPLCHTCESWVKLFFCQVLSRDLASTLSTLVGELSRSDGEDTLEEQTAVLLQLPRNLEDVCKQLCEKLQKVPLPALGHVAAPVGPLCPVLCSTPPTHAIDDHVRCTVIALSGNVVAELFVLKGEPWLDVIPFGCWCQCWNVASFHLSDKDMVVFPQPRASQLVPSHGPDIVVKLITSNDPPPVNIRVVIGKAAATYAAYRPQPIGPVRSTSSASCKLSSTTLIQAAYSLRAWTRLN